MSAAVNKRTGRMIMTDLYNLTNDMARQLSDPDFLAAGMDKRQALMDEYDAFRSIYSDEEISEIKQMAQKILEMDVKISAALDKHRNMAKNRLMESQSQRKAMSYAVGNISSSGSYMNLTK